MCTKFWLENLKRRNHSKLMHSWIILDRGEIWWEGVDWIQLAQDRDQLQALVNITMNLQIPKSCGTS
jgi:hypothetical protein